MEVTLTPDADFEGRRIGLLGGSFNPAHAAHLEMSLFARARLKLDAIWWLVSPGNPLKKTNEMQAFSIRLNSARMVAKDHPEIVVTDIEKQMNTRYTIDTLRALRTRFPKTRFVWLMGDDNLPAFHLWRSWEDIMREVPIAIFKRSGYLDSHERGIAAAKFAASELSLKAVEDLAVSKPPAWVILDNTPNPLSATQIRKRSQPT